MPLASSGWGIGVATSAASPAAARAREVRAQQTPAPGPADTADQAHLLRRFRAGLYSCLTGWADAAFELSDAVLCAPAPVCSVPALSLEPVVRRSHASLYKARARGGVDAEAMRDLLAELSTVILRHKGLLEPDGPEHSQHEHGRAGR